MRWRTLTLAVPLFVLTGCNDCWIDDGSCVHQPCMSKAPEWPEPAPSWRTVVGCDADLNEGCFDDGEGRVTCAACEGLEIELDAAGRPATVRLTSPAESATWTLVHAADGELRSWSRQQTAPTSASSFATWDEQGREVSHGWTNGPAGPNFTWATVEFQFDDSGRVLGYLETRGREEAETSVIEAEFLYEDGDEGPTAQPIGFHYPDEDGAATQFAANCCPLI